MSASHTPEQLPLVAIVGAPNVGKSTLFNRLVRRRVSIVTDEPGVTRDRIYGVVDDTQIPFRLVDTGGLVPDGTEPYTAEIGRQAELALREAAAILFVVDTRAGITATDREIVAGLRRRPLPLVLVANKVDTPAVEHEVHALHELGLGDPLPVSAEHGLGVAELLDKLGEILANAGVAERAAVEEEGPQPLKVAIVGRPNVGKSSLLNRLLGEDRAVVSDVAGTTRDAVDTLLEVAGKHYRIIDTAGIRRRGRVHHGVERFSVDRAQRNIDESDVVVLVLDAAAGFAAQDAHIAGYVRDAYRPMVVAVNKWDLIEGREEAAKEWMDEVGHRLRFAKDPPLVLISALSGQRVFKVLEHADELLERASIRVGTPETNRWLEEAAGPTAGRAGRRRDLRLYYATQTGVRPPRFVFFCNDPSRVHFSFRRYLENSLRERFGFGAVPIRMSFRRRREARGA